MSEDAVPLPAVVLVREHLSATVRMNVFFGRLVVELGEARFEPAGVGNKLNTDAPPTIRHRDRTVVVVYGWLNLPWMSTGIVLTDRESIGQFTASLRFPAWQRKAVVSGLRRAGFDAEVFRTTFSAGQQIGSVTELEQFRRQHKRSR